jgi:hypothetical protein
MRLAEDVDPEATEAVATPGLVMLFEGWILEGEELTRSGDEELQFREARSKVRPT